MTKSFLTPSPIGSEETPFFYGSSNGALKDLDGSRGVFASALYHYHFDAVAAQSAALSPPVLTTQPGYITLSANVPSAVTQITYFGEVGYKFDVPRAVSVDQGVIGSAVPVIVWGVDAYGARVSCAFTTAPGLRVFSSKTFLIVLRVWVGGVTGTGDVITVGSALRIGLPYYISRKSQIIAAYYDATPTSIAASSYQVGDALAATNSTGDTRGYIDLPNEAAGPVDIYMAVPGAFGSEGTLTGQQAIQGVAQFNDFYIP